MNLEQALRAADRRAVALGLPEGVALVEFVRSLLADFQAVPARGEPLWNPAHYVAFVLPAGEPDNIQMIDLGAAEPIDHLIADFRSSITGETQRRSDRDMAKRQAALAPAVPDGIGPILRAAVFDKLIPALDGRVRLVLAPDGDLARLPFEVLPQADGRRLIDDYQVSYLNCGRDVLCFTAPTSGQPAPRWWSPILISTSRHDHGAAWDSGRACSAAAGRPPQPTSGRARRPPTSDPQQGDAHAICAPAHYISIGSRGRGPRARGSRRCSAYRPGSTPPPWKGRSRPAVTRPASSTWPPTASSSKTRTMNPTGDTTVSRRRANSAVSWDGWLGSQPHPSENLR
jgi:hypothetical protein